METLPHVFLVGEGAARFANEWDFERCNLLTEESAAVYRKFLSKFMPEDVFLNLSSEKRLTPWIHLTSNPDKVAGTVNFIARDGLENIACGVSTSGWFAKYPGRLGDSPVIGAGNYADNRYGAAACTGMGEMAIRSGTARSMILYMKMGLTLEQAGIQAMKDLNDLEGDFLSDMNIIAIDKHGNPAGFTSNEGQTFICMTDTMDEPIETSRAYVPIRNCWGSK
jgi:beta-aspartyl-peptidase (threonine type)